MLKVDQKDLAASADISAQTITGYLRNGRLPNQKTLAAWVKAYGLDAHWLLTGEGEMFPAKAQGQAVAIINPMAVRLDELARLLGGSGVDELEILRAQRAMLDGEMEMLAKARGGYRVCEPIPSRKAAEEPAGYPAPQQAAGDDSV